MRYYGFGNYYLSSIQQGIQSLHVVSDMSVAYPELSEEKEAYNEWALHHKTVVLCNGGNSQSLAGLYEYFEELKAQGMELPFAKFNEDDQSLNNALTAVGIVVYSRHYEYDEKFIESSKKSNLVDNQESYNDFVITKDFNAYCEKGSALGYQGWELQLMYEIKKYPLAK